MKKVALVWVVLLLAFCAFAQDVDSLLVEKYMNSDIEDLLQVDMYAPGKQNQKPGEIPASITIINRSEIKLFGYNNVNELLNSVMGYYVMENLGVQIHGVRGYAKEKGVNFVIMINGVRITDERILSFYDLPIDAVDRVEVVRGPMSVVYGNNAFFGTINVITNQNFVEEDKANITSVAYGSLNTKEFFAKLFKQESNFVYSLNVGYLKSDGNNFNLADMMIRPEKMDEPLFGGADGQGLGLPVDLRTTEGRLAKERKYLDFYAQHNDLYFSVQAIEAANDRYYHYPALYEANTFNTYSYNFVVGYRHSFNTQWSINATFRYSRYNTYEHINFLFPEFIGWYGYKRSLFNADISTSWTDKKDKFSLLFGTEFDDMFQFTDETDVFLGDVGNAFLHYISPKSDAITLSFYNQLIYKPTIDWRFIGGIRISTLFPYDILLEYEKGMGTLGNNAKGLRPKAPAVYTPSIAIIRSINESSFLKLTYGKAVKLADPLIIGEDLLDISDGLKTQYSEPEFIETFELNYNGKFGFDWMINGSVFYNKLNNLLVEKTKKVDTNRLLRAIWTNDGEVNTIGAEISIRYQPGSQWTFLGNATYQQSSNETYQVDNSYSPSLLMSVMAGYKFSAGYSVSVSSNYVSGMRPFFNSSPILDTEGSPTDDYIGYTSIDVPAYWLVNMNLHFEPKSLKGFYLSLKVNNLFDIEQRYPTFSINNAWADKGTLGSGRTLMYKLGFRF